MSWTAVAIVGGTVAGSLLSSNAAKDAANTQAGAADRASQVQLQMFNRTQENLAPWLQAGKMSLATLSQGMGAPKPGDQWTNPKDGAMYQFDGTRWTDMGGAPVPSNFNVGFTGNAPLLKPFGLQDFQESPAYQFNLQQGQRAIENAASKNKTLYAPTTLQDIGKYSQGLASNEFQNAYSNYNTNMNNIWSRLYSLSSSGQNAGASLGGFGTTVAGNVGDSVTGGAAAQAAGRVGSANAINSGIGQGVNALLMNQLLQNNQRSSVSLQGIPGMNGANDVNFGMVA